MADPVNTVPPVISGSPTVGLTLSTDEGSWTNSPTTFQYQWKRETGVSTGVYDDVAGATRTTYQCTSADLDRRIEVEVIASNTPGGDPGPALGAVLFDGTRKANWPNQIGTAGHQGDSTVIGTIDDQADPFGDGNRGIRVILPAHTNPGIARCELDSGSLPPTIQEGTETVIMTEFMYDWTTTGAHVNNNGFQWHAFYDPCYSGGSGVVDTQLRFMWEGGTGGSTCNYSGDLEDFEAFEMGAVYRMKAWVKWEPNNSGWVQAWLQKDGGSWVEIIPFTNMATITATRTPGGQPANARFRLGLYQTQPYANPMTFYGSLMYYAVA